MNARGRVSPQLLVAMAERDMFLRSNGFHDYGEQGEVEAVAMPTGEAEFCEWPREGSYANAIMRKALRAA